MAKTCGIYRISRIGTTECYVGQSVDIRKRLAVHRYDLSRGKHSAKFMQRVHDKHGIGVFAFDVLESGFDPLDKSGLRIAEQRWMDRLAPAYNWFPANEARTGRVFSDEEKARRSERMKGNQYRVGKSPPHKGHKLSDEVRRLISISRTGQPSDKKGIPRTDEVRRKISLAKSGRPSSKKGMPSGKKGTPWTDARRHAFIHSKEPLARDI